ncbi:MAG: ABC transporter permease [Mycobacterium sp.]|nr:ABC transporter permease [Mycobacterium sp.]
MSTALRQPMRSPTPAPASDFAGTGQLLRLYLRRDRIVAPLWILLLSLPLASVYVGSIEKLYPTQSGRAEMAATIMSSPAQRAMYGNVYNDSLGAVGLWKAGIYGTLIAVATILTVIRHTRADEEAGRAELLGSTAVGRYAGLTAALLLTYGATVLTGLIGFVALLGTAVPAAGSLAFCLGLTGSGLVFGSVAAVAAQLSPSARTCRGISFSALGAAFALRAVGDASSATGSSVLSWLSPLGWSLQVRAFAGDRFAVLGLHVITCAALTALAYALIARRDVGAGLFPERPGPATASASLSGPFGLAWRVSRGSVLLWTVGICLYGLMIGSVAHGIGDELGDAGAAHDFVTRVGGTGAIEQAFITVAFTMVAMVASAFVVSLTLRLHQEEDAGRAETVLAGSVSRTHWLASYLVLTMLASALAVLLAGAIAGLVYAAAAGDMGRVPDVVGAAAVQLPGVWLLAAATVLIVAVTPRFAPAAWAVLVGFIALFLLGSLAGFPAWLLDLEPYSHAPRVGIGAFTGWPLLWLLLLDAALIALGFTAFRRRDLR